jgi:hypothetical protein
MKDIEIIHSEAIYGAKTRKPLVKISWGDKQIVVDTHDAKRIAYDLLDVAHASDGDAFIVHYIQNKVGLSLENAMNVLIDFRDERIRMNGEN